MSRIFVNPKVTLSITMALTEPEARALYSLAEYGVPKLMEVYKKCLGSAADDHLKGLDSLFTAVREELHDPLDRADVAAQVFRGELRACHPRDIQYNKDYAEAQSKELQALKEEIAEVKRIAGIIKA